MEYRKLGKTDTHVSVVGIGTWAMGTDFWGPTNDNDSIAAIQTGIDSGINIIDTAPSYGDGHAEEIVGKAIAGRKEKIFVVTKVGVVHTNKGFQTDLKPESITKGIESSLKRLGVDTIDLYMIHWPDTNTPLEDSIETLLKLQQQGKYRYLGVSNFDIRMMDFVQLQSDLVSLQPHYSLLHRDIEKNIVPYCIDNTIALITYGTLAGGILTGKYTDIPQQQENDKRREFYDFFHEPLWSRAQKLIDYIRTIAVKRNKTVSQVVINWTMQQPGITAILTGVKTPEQILENADAGTWELDNDELDDIDDACQKFIYEPDHETV